MTNPGTSSSSSILLQDTSTPFVRADSSNLPHLDEIMILEYMANCDKHNIAEIRGAKILMSSRDSYLESAVGYVEIRRTIPNICLVRAKVIPEHKISSKAYLVTVLLHEKEQEVKDVTCDGCAASAGGCKHALLLLFWLNKKSNEPASTSVQCYWKKPKLSSVRTEPIAAENIYKTKKKVKLANKDPSILQKFKEESEKHSNKDSLIILFLGKKIPSYNLFDMTLEYIQSEKNFDFNKYKSDLDKKITPEIIKYINKNTILQADSKLWHNIRQGRITASIIYEASQCHTDGSLVQRILGGYKIIETKEMKRGRKLEGEIIKHVEQLLQKKIKKAGFILINSMIGASPDGLAEDFIVEVKSPSSQKYLKNYVFNNKISSKYMAQMQTQMLAANKKKGLFCVGDPTFETTKKVHLYWVQYDPPAMENLLQKATNFWQKYIYDKIIQSARL